MLEFTDQDIMPFGKFKGRTMERVPAKYLLWLYDDMREQGDCDTGFNTNDRKNVFEYIEGNFKSLQSEATDYDSKFKPK